MEKRNKNVNLSSYFFDLSRYFFLKKKETKKVKSSISLFFNYKNILNRRSLLKFPNKNILKRRSLVKLSSKARFARTSRAGKGQLSWQLASLIWQFFLFFLQFGKPSPMVDPWKLSLFSLILPQFCPILANLSSPWPPGRDPVPKNPPGKDWLNSSSSQDEISREASFSLKS